MRFPTIFISNSKIKIPVSESLENYSNSDLKILIDKGIKSKLLIIDNKDYLLFSHVNIGCRRKLTELSDNIEKLVEDHSLIISDMHWGFLLIIDKKTNELKLFNDVYGIYPVYYTYNGGDFIISNDFDGLLRLLGSVSFDIHGLYDYFLFNYTIKSRTIIKEISQLCGGSVVAIRGDDFKVSKTISIDSLIFSGTRYYEEIEEMSNALSKHVQADIDPDLPVEFPVTGGFDSKVILSILLAGHYKFSSFTFGMKDSADHIAALSIAQKYQFSHEFLDTTEDFIKNLDSHLDKFLRCYPNAPMFDTLLYYQIVKETIADSNLVTGQMGGELIVGPVLISELITTRTASLLTMCKDKTTLLAGLTENILEMGFIEINKFEENKEEYSGPLLGYMQTSNGARNKNVINFLLNETYAKFFGVVFCNLFTKFNVINPMVDLDFLKALLNSTFSFTGKRPFSKAPLSHFMSRRIYPKLIREMDPSVLGTRMDRGYNLEDFLHWYNFPRPFLNYFKRHFSLKESRNKFSSLKYIDSLKKIATEVLESSQLNNLDIFEKESLIKLVQDFKNNKTTHFQTQKVLQLLTIHFFIQRYSGIIKIN